MRVLVVGSGAREHALCWRLHKDASVAQVFCAPGNAGIAATARILSAPGGDMEALVAAARAHDVDLAVIGPEAPLVAGAVDAFEAAGIAAFGPSRAAAQLEASKVFSKELMARHGIPTAAFEVFDDADAAAGYVRDANRPLVVKADGLAAGKGVVVAKDTSEALEAIDRIMVRRAFGDAGARVVIEECLDGQEVSVHVISDGERWVKLAPAQDHKRALDGDQGPNTGGMGAYSPPPIVDAALEARIDAEVIEPTLRGMALDGMPYRGALFVGLMVEAGVPRVLEYNVRFGDPECECILARLGGELGPALMGSARGDLGGYAPEWSAPCSMCVMLASGGYPASYETGKTITGLDAAGRVDGVTVFHAGAARKSDRFVTAGGRVLGVTAVGESITEAADRAYRAADLVDFDGKHCRRDIGHHAR